MRYHLRTLVAISALCFLFTSCQKEFGIEGYTLPTNPGGGNPGGGNPGGGTGGGTGSTADCKGCVYIPMCDGSVYTYLDTMNGVASTISQTMQVRSDSTIDGKVFSKVVIPGSNPSFYNCTNGVSTIVAFNPVSVGGTTVTRLEQIMLKADEPVGATWRSSLTNSGQVIDYDYEIIAKGISRTVLGTTYNDVIQVHSTITTTAPGLGSIVGVEADYYYAKDIGLIENISINAMTGTMQLHRVLQSYSIP